MNDDDWRSKVYKPDATDPILLTMPRSIILKRDRYICQSCRKRFPANQLSIHHIIPRAEGGTNKTDNLITLCWKCHDLVEMAEPSIRKRQQILYHAKSLKELERQIHEAGVSKEVAETWHAWVYGGMKRPT